MQPAYSIILHESAQNELDTIPAQARSTLKTKIQEASQHKQPSDHSCAKPLRNTDGLFRLREGDYRCLCKLETPHLMVLAVGEREGFYEEYKSKAMDRATDSI